MPETVEETPIEETAETTPAIHPEIPPEIPHGYMQNAQGHLIPESKVRDQHKLTDQTVKKIFDYADELSQQIARFKGHTYDDLAALTDLLREKYGAEKYGAEKYRTGAGGAKGNMSFTSFDGRMKVVVAVADHLDFGPELKVAKELLDEFLADEAKTASDAIRSVIHQVFAVDKPGRVNREALFALRQIEVDDARWQKAMEAISDSIRIAGSKTYIRIYARDTAEGRFRQVPLSLAAV